MRHVCPLAFYFGLTTRRRDNDAGSSTQPHRPRRRRSSVLHPRRRRSSQPPFSHSHAADATPPSTSNVKSRPASAMMTPQTSTSFLISSYRPTLSPAGSSLSFSPLLAEAARKILPPTACAWPPAAAVPRLSSLYPFDAHAFTYPAALPRRRCPYHRRLMS